MLENDILDLENLHSIPRTRFEKDVINLREEALPVVDIPEGFEVHDLRITSGKPSEMREFIEPMALRMENSGFPS